MKLTVTDLDEIVLVEITGSVDIKCSGRLYDTLVAAVGHGGKKLIVDMSETRSITRAAVRSLVVASKLSQSRGGEMRICGAEGPLAQFLTSLGHDYLVKCDPSFLTTLMNFLSEGSATPVANATDYLEGARPPAPVIRSVA